MNDIIKIIQSIEDSNILLRGITNTIKNKAKEQKGGFLSMLLGSLGASLLENLLSGERNCKSWLWPSFKKRKRNCKSWLWSSPTKRLGFLMSPHPLTNFETQKYYENEPKFNGVFSRDNLP